MNDIAEKTEKNSVDAVLRLLMLTVYADRVQKPQEMTELWRQLPKLKVFTEGEYFPDVRGLNRLISKNDAEVRHLLDESSLNTEIENAINLIDSPVLIPMVLGGMQAVARADGNVHHTENSIIELASDMHFDRLDLLVY